MAGSIEALAGTRGRLTCVSTGARKAPKKAAERRVPQAKTGKKTSDGLRNPLWIGTSGWAYGSWKPEFYPQTVPQRKFLEYYVTQLNSVEVNYTFRQLPTQGMIAGWLAASSPGFRFSFKAPQRITHMLRLKGCSEAISALSHALAPAASAGRMGVVLFQLPPNFKADLSRLESFLKDCKGAEVRMAFEFRNSTWFCDEVYALLRQYRVALCIAESDDLETPDVATAAFTCYRFRKSAYSRARLGKMEKTLRQRSDEGEVFAYFKHEEEPTGAIGAAKMLRKLQRS
jgi:uncharacterized protein YecE (DUF72 family)